MPPVTATTQTAPNAAAPTPPAAAPAAAPGGSPTRGSFALKISSTARPSANPLTIPSTVQPGTPAAKPTAAPPAALTAAAPAAPTSPAANAPAADPAEPAATPAPVVGRGGKALKNETLEERLARQRRQLWREEFGTDDPVKVQSIKAQRRSDLEQFQKLKLEREEHERAQMSKEQQLNADLEAERTRVAELQKQIDEMKTGQVVSEQTQQLTNIAGKWIDETMIEYALEDFRRHLSKLGPEEIKRMTPGAINRWFRKHAEERPKFAKITPAPAAADTTQTQTQTEATTTTVTPDPKPAVRRVPIVTSTKPKGGAPSAKPPATPDPSVVNGKTFKPGQKNSMSPSEVKATLRQMGRRPW